MESPPGPRPSPASPARRARGKGKGKGQGPSQNGKGYFRKGNRGYQYVGDSDTLDRFMRKGSVWSGSESKGKGKGTGKGKSKGKGKGKKGKFASGAAAGLRKAQQRNAGG